MVTGIGGAAFIKVGLWLAHGNLGRTLDRKHIAASVALKTRMLPVQLALGKNRRICHIRGSPLPHEAVGLIELDAWCV